MATVTAVVCSNLCFAVHMRISHIYRLHDAIGHVRQFCSVCVVPKVHNLLSQQQTLVEVTQLFYVAGNRKGVAAWHERLCKHV